MVRPDLDRYVPGMSPRLLHRLIAPAFALLALSACKQEEKTVEAKDYAQEMSSSFCEAVFSCSCETYPYDNFNQCYAGLNSAYAEAVNEAYLAGLSYDGTCPAKQLEQLESLACKSALPELPAGVCAPPCNAWHGSLPVGSFCEVVASNVEAGVAFSACAQGLSCVGGVCVNPCQLVDDLPGLGQPCPQFVCAEGATCDLESQICVALPQLPGPGEACVDGLCDPDRAICVADANVCAALPTIGQPCVMGQCDANSYCSIADDVCLARPALVCGLLVGDVGGDGDGDGDGDPTTTGDGDGDPTTTGDGDGDPTTTGDGDGDGDPTTTGDGDGDPTGDPIGQCGWDPNNLYYECGFDGSDPEGTFPYACPPGLIEGDVCGEVTGEGCCDAAGDNWYCGDDGNSQSLVFNPC